MEMRQGTDPRSIDPADLRIRYVAFPEPIVSEHQSMSGPYTIIKRGQLVVEWATPAGRTLHHHVVVNEDYGQAAYDEMRPMLALDVANLYGAMME